MARIYLQKCIDEKDKTNFAYIYIFILPKHTSIKSVTKPIYENVGNLDIESEFTRTVIAAW